MTRNFTLLNVFLIFCISSSIFGQNTIINNFETVSPTVVTRYGTTFSIVANPNSNGNTSAYCAKIGRTSTNWYELFAFPTSFTVPANTSKYLHVKVNYASQPDISIRIDAANENADGGADIRALNAYTNFGTWQDLVFKLDGGVAGATVNAILILPDLGFNNMPAGQVLNNTDKFGYIDEIILNDSSQVLDVNELEKNNSIAIYPNPTSEFLTISNLQPDTVLSVTSLDGKNIYQNNKFKNDNLTLSIKEWAKGVYIIRIQNGSETVAKKFIVN